LCRGVIGVEISNFNEWDRLHRLIAKKAAYAVSGGLYRQGGAQKLVKIRVYLLAVFVLAPVYTRITCDRGAQAGMFGALMFLSLIE